MNLYGLTNNPRAAALTLILPGDIMLVQRLPQVSFDDGLTANVKLQRHSVQLFQHIKREVNIDPFNRGPHFTLVGKIFGNVLAAQCHFSDLIGGWLLFIRFFAHITFPLVLLISKGLPDGNIHLSDLL